MPEKTEEVKFPNVSARDGTGERVYLPVDLVGDPTLVLVSFRWQQRSLVEMWREFASGLADRYDRFEYYELHVVGPRSGMTPPVLSGGMRPTPGRADLGDRTLPGFVDKGWFRRSLGLLGETTVYALLVDGGYVVRRAAGTPTEDVAAGLESLLDEWEDALRRWNSFSSDAGANGDAAE